MFVDASAMIAILLQEPRSDRFVKALEDAARGSLYTSVIALWEATVAMYRKKSTSMVDAQGQLEEFTRIAGIRILPVTPEDNHLALKAFDLHGRHRHPDESRSNALNLADCFHYAISKSRSLPMLTKDVGFALTDVETIGPEF